MPRTPEKFDQTCGYKAKRTLYAVNGVIRLSQSDLATSRRHRSIRELGRIPTVKSDTGPLGRLRICYLVLSIAYLEKAAD